MAVAKHSSSAPMMPNHIADPAIGAPYSDCIWNVSHKKAPGAISAIALTVRPVKPSVALVVEDLSPPPGFEFAEDMLLMELPPSTGHATTTKCVRQLRKTLIIAIIEQTYACSRPTAPVAIYAPKEVLATRSIPDHA